MQDLPISKPFTKEELDVLVSQKEVPRYCDYYVNLLSAGPRLPSVVDRMKSIAGVARFAVCKVCYGLATVGLIYSDSRTWHSPTHIPAA